MKQKLRSILKSKWFMLLLILLGISLCIRIKTEYEYYTKYTWVTENASDYIRNKYGFHAELVSTPEKNSSYWEGEKGSVSVTMRYDGKEFWVEADKSKDNPECFDNYQEDEIAAAAERYISEKLPDGKIISLRYSDRNSAYCFFINDYFDGSNLEQILENCYASLEMVFADREFSEADIAELPFDSIDLTAFDTAEHRDEFLSRLPEFRIYEYIDYQKYAPYITDYIGKSKDEITGLDVTLLETAEFAYAYFPDEWNTYTKSRNDIQAESREISSIHWNLEQKGAEQWVSHPISNGYYFDSGWGDVRIYYPLEKLQDHDPQNLHIVWYSFGGMSNNYGIKRAEICGEYAVFNIPFGRSQFVIVDDTDQESTVPHS
ncbi:MAG: hypothetical protein IJ265_06205 [Oscillospiraceae bacterium]|nr:hypothetical protein [Oscillospiraceae bacterium]